MTVQQGLDSLLHEVEAVLRTEELAPQRRPYFEGARDYLTALKGMTTTANQTDKKPRKPKPTPGGVPDVVASRSPPSV